MAGENVPAPWSGMGIRIEDDVVVTSEGSDVLSREAPKDIEGIEALLTA